MNIIEGEFDPIRLTMLIISIILVLSTLCLSMPFFVEYVKSVTPSDNVANVATTWTQEPPCINGAGHGDGVCGHSSSSCWECNCTKVVERWCDNETAEWERIRQGRGGE
jgi:hypothetical protein